MREIKFRVWDKKNKKWFYWKIEDPFMCDWGHYLDDTIRLEADWHTLGEYTGLKDKNGKEIYEGDIFLFGTKKGWKEGESEKGIVEWHKELARFGLTFYSIYGGEGYTGKSQHLVDLIKGCKIIGNIHENPELLKSGK